jgi:asparagine synthase (glutamine-hydrolysing)
MCGITGFIDYQDTSSKDLLTTMVKTLTHRGPDDYGVEIISNSNANIGLGQSRLSIIDLSQAGHQPMHYQHLSIVFNGEIYNYKSIRKDLEELGHKFFSDTDTEVILRGVAEWGQQAVHRFIGMFVYAIYDSNTQCLTITRDRAGVKPLYYWINNGLFLFGSELKALMAHPRFEKEIDLRVMPSYLHHGYIPTPYSIFKNCYKLQPGHHLTFSLSNQIIEIRSYWDVLTYYRQPKMNINYKDAKGELHEILKSAFNYRMVADVPVGVFLSGGFDSTAVASVLQAQRTEKLKTFTIGFEGGNNEAPYARQTAELLGTDHTEYICTTEEGQAIIPTLPYYYDEPFGDSSAIPTTLVSRIAREKVTVALSADGGDETFCGYNSYFKLNQLNQRLNLVPAGLKSSSKLFASLAKTLPVNKVTRHKAVSALEAVQQNEAQQLQLLFKRMNEKPKSYVANYFNNPIIAYSSPYEINIQDFNFPGEIALAIDYKSYLQNDILTKVDRATMSVSLEGREPLLDHSIIEYVARLPFDYKYAGGENGKRILKDIVYQYVPKAMMDRPKSGFSLPIYDWLLGDLDYLLDEYLSKEALSWSGVFNVDFVYGQVTLFKKKKMHYSPIIWYLLMFQMWWKQWMS